LIQGFAELFASWSRLFLDGASREKEYIRYQGFYVCIVFFSCVRELLKELSGVGKEGPDSGGITFWNVSHMILNYG
jgi:hypothetical protein